MATVDTGVRFNKFNSLKLEINETSWSQKFEVEFYSTITVQAQVLCVTGSASGQFILRWLDEDGKKIIDSTDGFSIENRWRRKTATFEVPEGAIECMFALKNTDSTEQINVACAMAEAGEIASAFDPSLATQVSLLDAHGLYTGTVTAWQVIAGILQSLDGKAYFDLEKPEIVMHGKDAKLEVSPANPLMITDADGNVIGGVAYIDGELSVFASKMTNSPEADFYMRTGTFQSGDGSFSGIIGEKAGAVASRFAIGSTYSSVEEFAFETPILAIRAQPTFLGGGVFLPTAGLILQDETGRASSTLGSQKISWSRLTMVPFNINITTGKSVLGLGDFFASSPPREAHLGVHYTDADTVQHAIGVDGTGPYYMKNGGAKQYF